MTIVDTDIGSKSTYVDSFVNLTPKTPVVLTEPDDLQTAMVARYGDMICLVDTATGYMECSAI